MSSEPVRITDPVKFGEDFELDVRAYELRRGGRPLKLERIPMELLVLLVEMRGQLVTRDQIIERIWGKDVFFDSDNSINSAVRKIRQVLKDDPDHPRFVVTVTGKGYRFVAPVEEASPRPSPTPTPSAVSEVSPQATESLLGKKISHYRILQMLGGGGMGVVYKAEDLKLGRLVAMKFLPSEVGNDPLAFERLQREARAASSLDHPNICSIYEFGEHEGQPFIVMQLLEGQTLREWIAGPHHSTSRIRELVDLGAQIADGLQAAHDKGIIHRDIKPANIFITARGQAKILDFGVAKYADASGNGNEREPDEAREHDTAPVADPRLTATGASVGTPSYLSPEQIRHEKLDKRTDLFSFGLVLYEMATGQRAFPGKTATVIRDAVLSSCSVPPRQVAHDVPVELEKIVTRSLEKDPERRYQSAAEMKIDLEKVGASLHPAGWRGPKAAILIASVAILGLILYSGVRWIPLKRSDTTAQIKARPSIAVLGLKNLSGKDEEAWIGTAVSEMLGAELASGQRMRVVPSENVARMKLDLSLPSGDSYAPDTLKKIHSNLNSDMVVLGSYLAVGKDSGGKVRIDLQLQDTEAGETIAVVSQDGTEGDLAALVSQSGNALRRKLGIGDLPVSDASQVAASVPGNIEAARFYADGLARLQKFDALAARDLLEKAIAADPNHALSHAALASSWSSLGYDTKAKEEAKKAMDLSANLPREERLSIEGRYREYSNDLPGAIDIYHTLYTFFPDNLDYGLRWEELQAEGNQAKESLATIARLRAMPSSQAQDARLDLDEAFAARVLGDYKHQLQAAGAAVSKGQAQGATLIIAAGVVAQGWAYEHLGEPDKAMPLLSQAHDLFAAKNPRESAWAELIRGHVFYDKGNFAEAQKCYEQSLNEYRKIGNKGGEARALESLGNILYEQGRPDEAKRYHENELRIDREIESQKGIASSLGNLANDLEALGDLHGAANSFEQALAAFKEIGNKRSEATSYGNWGGILVEMGELESAKKKIEDALQLQQEIGYKRGMAFSQSSLATILYEEDHMEEARQAADQAMSLRKEMGDKDNVAWSQTQIAQILLEQGKAAEAEAVARESAKTFQDLKVPEKEILSEAVLTEALLAQQKKKEAQASADRTAELAKQTTAREFHFEAAITGARALAASGKMADAIKTAEAVRAEASRYGYIEFELEIRLLLGELELRSGKTVAGRAHLAQLHDDARNKQFARISRKAKAALDGKASS